MGVGVQRPGKRLDTHCTGGWEGPRAGLNGCKKSRPLQAILGPSKLYQVAVPTMLSQPTVNYVGKYK